MQPVEGRYKVYILDEAHQLTDAAFNALLKLIEEPPPHLVFVFCTTELQKMLATVRSRCQTFVLSRPRLPEIVRYLKTVAEGEGIEAPEAALALDRPLGARKLPRRGVDARPAVRGDRGQGHRAGGAAAPRRGRGGGAVPDLRLRRRPRHGRCADVPRGARRAGPGSRPPRHRSARASPARAPRPAHGRGARLAAADGRDARAPARSGEPARRGDGRSGSAICSRSPSTTCARAETRAFRSSSRSSRSRGRRPTWSASRPRTASSSSRARTHGARSPIPSNTVLQGPEEAAPLRRLPRASRLRSSSRSSRRPGSGRSCRPSSRSRSRPRRCCARRIPRSSTRTG